jgi:hypothetical protein
MQFAFLVKLALYVVGCVPALAGIVSLFRTPWATYQRSANRKARDRVLNIIVGLYIISVAIITGSTAFFP